MYALCYCRCQCWGGLPLQRSHRAWKDTKIKEEHKFQTRCTACPSFCSQTEKARAWSGRQRPGVRLPWFLASRDRIQIWIFWFDLIWFDVIIYPGLQRSNGMLVKLRPCKKLILKAIGNRKGHCAWSCSRWQTQPEKICKSQCTNQCHSLRILYWFVLCNFQIFSGCVCHLEQLHAQSPFLFPIVFSINLIPFFDICSAAVLAVFQPGCSGMCYFTWVAARSQQLLFVVLAAGLWCLTAGCHVKSPLVPQPPLKQKCAPWSRWEKAYMRKHIQVRPSSLSQSNALREQARHTNLLLLAIGCRADCTGERRTSPFNGMERSLNRAVIIKTKSLPVSATTFRTALSLYIAHDGRKHKHNPTLSANKHVVQICRSSLSAATDGLADGSGERRTSPVNGIERLLSRAVVTKTKSLPVSAPTFPVALPLYIAQERLRKDIRPLPSCSHRQNRHGCNSKRK